MRHSLFIALGAVALECAAASYVRVERPCDRTNILEVAAIRLVCTNAAAARPPIWLVGAVHVGEAGYYREVQRLLDSCPTVLFECVSSRTDWPAPAAFARKAGSPAAGAAKDGKDRRRALMRFAVIAAARLGRVPASADEIRAALAAGHHYMELRLLPAVRHPPAAVADYPFLASAEGLRFDPADKPVDVMAAARKFLAEDDFHLQRALAEMLGLEFQLDAIRYDSPSFVHCDMDEDELVAAAGGTNTPAARQFAALRDSLDGTGVLAGFARFAFSSLKAVPGAMATFRLMLTEVMPEHRAMLRQVPAPIRHLVLDARNDHVVAALRALPSGGGSVAVFYGAAHLPGIQRQLVKKDGYRVAERRWLPAIHATTDDVPPESVAFIRNFLLGAVRGMK